MSRCNHWPFSPKHVIQGAVMAFRYSKPKIGYPNIPFNGLVYITNKIQENLIFIGKKHAFRLRFSLKPIH